MKKKLILLTLVWAFLFQTIVSAATISQFKDVQSGAWYYGRVDFCIQRNLFGGISDTEFAPTMPMTRGMLVTVLGRYENVNTANYCGSSFNDVLNGSYYEKYIEWAKTNGIVNGRDDTYFAPDEQISRQDLCTIFVRYLEGKGYSLTERTNRFIDDSYIAAYAKNAVYKLANVGIVNGYEDGRFFGSNSASRAEVATMFYNLINWIEAKQQTETIKFYSGIPMQVPDYGAIYNSALLKTTSGEGYKDFFYNSPANFQVNVDNYANLLKNYGYVYSQYYTEYVSSVLGYTLLAFSQMDKFEVVTISLYQGFLWIGTFWETAPKTLIPMYVGLPFEVPNFGKIYNTNLISSSMLSSNNSASFIYEWPAESIIADYIMILESNGFHFDLETSEYFTKQSGNEIFYYKNSAGFYVAISSFKGNFWIGVYWQ